MSAFIVSDNHINAIVSWMARPENNYGRTMLTEDCQQVGRVLMEENCKSVGHRYGHHACMAKECADSVESYRFKQDKAKRSAVEIIKACQCLEYQSCEHDGWSDSQAKRILDEVQSTAISKLPGYDAASWAIA